MNKIYTDILLRRRVIIKPKLLNSELHNNILGVLKKEIEGKCVEEGYIQPDSIQIIKRTIGMMLTNGFEGEITYDVLYSANVCNPYQNNVLSCTIKSINKLGLLGISGPLMIIIPKQYHESKNPFKNLTIGQNVNISVIDKKFNLYDKNISVVAKLHTNDSSSRKIITANNTPDLNQVTDSLSNIEISDEFIQSNIDSIAEDDEISQEFVEDDYYEGHETEIMEEQTQITDDLENELVVDETGTDILTDDEDLEEEQIMNELEDASSEKNTKNIIISGGYLSEEDNTNSEKEDYYYSDAASEDNLLDDDYLNY